MWRHLGALGAATMVSMLSLAAHGQDYAIRMERPVKVGDRFKVTATVGANITFQGSDPAQKNTSTTSAEVEAVGTVVSVSPKGALTAVTYTILKFKVKADGQDAATLPAGTVVRTIRSEGGELSVQPQGVELPEDASRLLGMALPTLHDPKLPGEDEVFGTADRKKVGDKWGANAGALARGFTGKEFTVAPEDAAGWATVEKLHHVGGVPCLRINKSGRIGKLVPQGMPPGIKVLSYETELKVSGDYPVDVSKPQPAGSLEMTMVIRTEKTTGQSVERMDMSSVFTAHQQYTPLPPAPAGDKGAATTASKPAPESRPAGTEAQKK